MKNCIDATFCNEQGPLTLQKLASLPPFVTNLQWRIRKYESLTQPI